MKKVVSPQQAFQYKHMPRREIQTRERERERERDKHANTHTHTHTLKRAQ